MASVKSWFHLPKILFSSLQLKLFNIKQHKHRDDFFTIFIIANRFTEFPAVLKLINEELKRKTIPNNTGRITDQRNDGANGFENKAMRIKARIGGIWENKHQAKKSAYWGYVRNSRNVRFHEKWMSVDPGIKIPRKYRNSKSKMKMINNERFVRGPFYMILRMK